MFLLLLQVNQSNPRVQLWISHLDSSEGKKQIFPPMSLSHEEAHFSGVVWADADNFAVQWMNRVQNVTVVTLCPSKGLGECKEIFKDEKSHGYIDYKYKIIFDPNNESGRSDFATIQADPGTDARYQQVLVVSGDRKTFLTSDKADVTEILQWAQDGYLYYMATLPHQPGTRHFYRVPSPRLRHSNPDLAEVGPECLSCNLSDASPLHRRACEYYSVSMSKSGSFYSMTCKGPDIPYTCLHKTDTNRQVQIWDENQDLINRIDEVELPLVKFLEVPVPGSDLKAQVRMYLPPDFDAQLQYPMVVYVYGGPGNQQVEKTFNQFDFQTYLSGSKGFIYAVIDPRGSGGQGEKWKFATYRGFGTVEVDSTIAATKYLQENMKYIDPEKTAIWGWSYGGYLSLSVLGHDKEDVFQCGASVAPVVDWTLYDTYYTERYMGLLDDNWGGYNRSRVFKHLENLRDKPYYLMHGTHDDNVHYQQSMLLSAALESKDILFRQQAYPDQDHSIATYQKHLYHSLTDFFLNDCFTEKKDRKR